MLILHIHGGGWVSQSPGQHLPYVSEWARYARVPVLSIDYSLSPETQFPIPVNECFAVYKWLQDPLNVKKLGLPICFYFILFILYYCYYFYIYLFIFYK